MRPRVVISYAIGSILIFVFVTGLRMSLDVADKYGWDYSRTVTMGTDVFVEEVSIWGQLFAEALILISGVMLIVTGLEVSRYSRTENTHRLYSVTEIGFTGIEPTHWDIWHDPQTHTVGVVLNGVGITFPLAMIEKRSESVPHEEDIVRTESTEIA